MEIRKMIQEDLDQVITLEKENFSCPWSLEAFQRGIKSKTDEYLVAVADGDIVGYLGFFFIVPEGEIQKISTKRNMRRQGIGSALMGEIVIISNEKSLAMINLEVRAGNEAAQNLYISYGFRKEGIRKGYYQNPVEDAIIMCRHSI